MKGMQKIKRGSGFRGAVSYALDNDNGQELGEVIGGNMSGSTLKELSSEFGVARKLRPDVKKPVWHNSLRLPEGDKLTEEQWTKIADDYMSRMGFSDKHPRVYVLHDEEKGQHIHIVASRVGLDGQLYLGKNENLISTQHIQALEKDYGLTLTKGPSMIDGRIVMPDLARPKAGEVGKFERTGDTPERFALAALIDTAIAGKPTATAFAERLVMAGVEVRANFSKDTLNGFSFSLNGVPFKGSQIGKQFTGKALFERGLSYEQDRDYAQLKSLSAASRGGQQHDAAAGDPGKSQPHRRDRAIDSRDQEDPGDVRGIDRAGAGGIDTGPGGDRGASAERSERTDRIVSKAEQEPGSVEQDLEGGRRGADIDSGARAGADKPLDASGAMARPSSPGTQSHDVGGGLGTGVDVSSAGLIETGDKGTDELLRAAHSGRLKAERENLSRQKKQHEEGMAAAKKRQAELDKPASSRLSSLADRSMDSTWRAMEMQRFTKALGAEKFQVVCTSANPKEKPISKVFTAAELQNPNTIKAMSHMSARRYDVSIRPDPASGVILLKGIDADGIKKLEAIGLQPAAVVDIAGKKEAWIRTDAKLSTDERTALTKRLETLTGVVQKHGGAGGLVGFSSGHKAVGLTACHGQVSPAVAEMLGEIKAERVEAKAKALLASAIEKTLVIEERDFVDVGGKHLRKGMLSDACRSALNDQSMFFAGKYAPAVVEQGVLEAMARQGVKASQAYRAVFDDSPVAAGDERHAADAVAQAFTRVALVKEGKDLASVDLATEAARRHPDLMKRAESRQDSQVKAYDVQVKASGEADSERLAKEAELERIAKAKAFEAAERIAMEMETSLALKPQ